MTLAAMTFPSVLNIVARIMGKTMARLNFTETLVWHAIKGRVHNGVVIVTDRLIAVEVALPPSMVRTVRRDLTAAGLIECWVTRRASEWPDDELLITLVPQAAAAAS